MAASHANEPELEGGKARDIGPMAISASGDRSCSGTSTSYGRFELGVTSALRQLLHEAANDDSVPEVGGGCSSQLS